MPLDLQSLTSSTWVDTVEHHAELSSTQDRAREAAIETPHARSLLVVADRQTAGRGRSTNEWWSGEGSLTFSLLFDPVTFGLPRRAMPQTSLATAAAVVDALTPHVGGHALGVHWPNDIYVADRKLAGILVDVLNDGRHIVGVGINTNCSLADAPPHLRDSIATTHWLTGRLVDHVELLEPLLERLGECLRMLADAPAVLGARFDQLCMQHGQFLTVRNGDQRITGRCAGIAPNGALLLDTQQGQKSIYSGTLR
jgi:BirA family biotin operon repressor/biotin-[acetyl-CoA-carboxylase] ligase